MTFQKLKVQRLIALHYGNILYNKKSDKDKETQIKQASHYYKLSTDKGNITSMNIYANKLYELYSINENKKKESADYFQKSAKHGKSTSINRYANILYEGD